MVISLFFSFIDMKAVHGVSAVPTLGHFAIAISSIAMHLSQFLERESIEQDMASFAAQYEYSLIVLMGINTNAKGTMLGINCPILSITPELVYEYRSTYMKISKIFPSLLFANRRS